MPRQHLPLAGGGRRVRRAGRRGRASTVDGRLGRDQPLPPRRGAPRAHGGRGAAARHRRSTTGPASSPPPTSTASTSSSPWTPPTGATSLRLAPDDDAAGQGRDAAAFGGADVDVPDPWGLPPAAYAEMYDLLRRGLPGTRRARRRAVTGDLPAELVDGLGVTGRDPSAAATSPSAFRLETADGPAVRQDPPGPDARRCSSARPPGSRALRARRRHRRARGRPRAPVRAGAGVDRRRWARPPPSEADLGRRLAALHRDDGPHFGGLDGAPAGYLGSQPVDLTPTDDWADVLRRATAAAADPAGRRARPASIRRASASSSAPRVTPPSCAVRPSRRRCCTATCGPATGWSTAPARNWLIDPAAYWGHREVDLAMMQLFGGFGTPRSRPTTRRSRWPTAGATASAGTSSRRCSCTPSCSAAPTARRRWTCSSALDDDDRHDHESTRSRPTGAAYVAHFGSRGRAARARPTRRARRR